MSSSRIVRGFHGTVIDHATEMAAGRFVENNKKIARWLGSGIYFFEENFELAQKWARIRAHRLNRKPAVLAGDIDLSNCLDLTVPTYQSIVRLAYQDKDREWTEHPAQRPQQKGLELHKGIVRTGYSGDWENYGRNELDFQVIEHAIALAKDTQNLQIDTVRGAFIELGPLYDTSWFYEGAHVAIAVRAPYRRLSNLLCLSVG